MQSVAGTSAYWQAKLGRKEVTMVSFSPKVDGPQKSKCWRVCKKFVNVKQSDKLPAIYKTVKNFAICPPCNQVIKYGNSPTVLVKHI